MCDQEIHNVLQTIFSNYFQIDSLDFDLNKSLEELNSDFKILSYLLFLEQLLSKEFNTKISLLENISSEIHAPKDIIHLIKNQLHHQNHKKETL